MQFFGYEHLCTSGQMFLFSLTRYLGMELQYPVIVLWASLMAQLVKNLPAMQATPVLFLGQEDPLEKEMATYISILVWKMPWTEEPGRLQTMGLQRVRHD